MKKTLKGFTLAEVLITLGVIGVVASLTLPALNVNVQRSQMGPALSKAINTLENTNKTLLAQNDVTALDRICAGNYISVCLPTLLVGNTVDDIPEYRDFDGGNGFEIDDDAASFVTKDGITFYQDNLDIGDRQVRWPERGLNGRWYTVRVDVNGPRRGPNQNGRDVYTLVVDTGGTVMAFGGRQWNDYMNMGETWEDNCNADEVEAAQFCAGAVVDNGFRVIHF